MKTVTAKEFQFNQSQMIKEVAKGTIYQVTYHVMANRGLNYILAQSLH